VKKYNEDGYGCLSCYGAAIGCQRWKEELRAIDPKRSCKTNGYWYYANMGEVVAHVKQVHDNRTKPEVQVESRWLVVTHDHSLKKYCTKVFLSRRAALQYATMFRQNEIILKPHEVAVTLL